jgi:hypothetical protein
MKMPKASKSMEQAVLKGQIEAFRNNAFCRREDNQRAARAIWDKIYVNFEENKRREFEIEWGHYMLGEFDADTFGFHFKKLLGDEKD